MQQHTLYFSRTLLLFIKHSSFIHDFFIKNLPLKNFSSINDSENYDDKGYYKQAVNEVSGVKTEVPNQPANYQNDSNYIQ